MIKKILLTVLIMATLALFIWVMATFKMALLIFLYIMIGVIGVGVIGVIYGIASIIVEWWEER